VYKDEQICSADAYLVGSNIHLCRTNLVLC